MTAENLKLYRKRYVPMELVHLKSDEILCLQKDILVTRWKTIRPRQDISGGISAYYIDKGFKVSKIFNEHHELAYWYCDIISVETDEETNTFTGVDLLLDVVVGGDGTVKVLDVGEAADMFSKGVIEKARLIDAMHKLDRLLEIIYSGRFSEIQEYINSYDNAPVI